MFNDDDFSFGDDDLENQIALSKIDNAKLLLAEKILSLSTDLRNSIRFNEQQETEDNIQMLSQYCGQLVRISSAETEGQSEEEIEDLISDIEKSATELTFNNIDKLLKAEEYSIAADEDEQRESNPPTDTDPGDMYGF